MMFIFGLGGSTALKLSMLARGAFREMFPFYTKRFVNSEQYWRDRYKFGGTSGKGSRERTAAEKAAFVNSFCLTHGSDTVVEFGCGDGYGASLINAKRYIGFDISDTAIAFAKDRCSKLPSHMFFNSSKLDLNAINDLIEQHALSDNIVSLSMEVIFHLVEDHVFENYIKILCNTPAKHIVVLSTDTDSRASSHVRDRHYSPAIENYGAKLIYTHPQNIAGQNFKVFSSETGASRETAEGSFAIPVLA